MSSHDDTPPAGDPGDPAEPGATPARHHDRYWIDDFQSGHRSAIRPYVRTGGRSRPSHDLRLETLVSAAAPGRSPLAASVRPTTDLTAIRDLCRARPLSVAEISAHLGLALGVARVLISDALTAGLLVLHDTGPSAGERPSLELMARVHRGLRGLA